MALSRRKALALMGGGTILAAGAGFTAFASTRTPTEALAPWGLAGSYADPRKNALSYALLAPNPHNLQPWLVELQGEDTVVLHRNPDKVLPETDPFDRQIFIGLGCFLEQMVLAAGAAGQGVDLTTFPEGEAGPVAHAVFKDGATADPLAAQIMDRRSCKEPYEDRAVAPAQASELELFADIYTDAPTVDALRRMTYEAWLIEYQTPRTLQESIDVMRMGKAEINATPDGIDIGGTFMESLMVAGIVSREAFADPNSMGSKQGPAIYKAMLDATPAYAVLTSATNTRVDQIEAGRRWLRLNLKTTAMGLALHPVSQALQEYPEMTTLYDAAHQMLASDGHTVQMLGRLGYGPASQRTPRWPLEAKMTRATA